MNCSLPDSAIECEITKQRNQFIVDKARLKRVVVERWIQTFFKKAGTEGKVNQTKHEKNGSLPFLEWEVRTIAAASKGTMNQDEIFTAAPLARPNLHESLMDLEALLAFSLVKP